MESDSDHSLFEIDQVKAKRYSAREAAKELRELEEKYPDESLSDSDSLPYEDDPEENEALKSLIEKIKNRDPEIYTGKTYFSDAPVTSAAPEKSFRLKEYYRQQTLDQMHQSSKLHHQVTYNPEQATSIEQFTKELDEVTVDGDLFARKEAPTEAETATDPEEFLRSYVLEGGWTQAVDQPLEDVSLENDSEELEMIEEFEKEVYEEAAKPGITGKFVTSKTPEQKRRRKELKKKLRDREQEKVKEAEIKRLKNLKKQQLNERLKVLKSVSGLSNRKLAKIDLKDAYNEREFNRMIDSLFDEQYFAAPDSSRPKIKGHSAEAQELQELEELVVRAETGKDQDIRALLSEIKGIGREYSSLHRTDRFEYLETPAVDIGISVKDILLADESELKRKFPLKKFAPYQTPEEKQRLERSLRRRQSREPGASRPAPPTE